MEARPGVLGSGQLLGAKKHCSRVCARRGAPKPYGVDFLCKP